MNETNALVTGGTGGIGYEVAAGLAKNGTSVFVTGRDERRGLDAVARLRAHAGHERVELLVSDGSSVRGARTLAAQLRDRLASLDLFVANVGGLVARRAETPEGIEATLATNFVVPIALTRELSPILARGARVVHVVSSALFMNAERDAFADLASRDAYAPLEVYARAKRLDLMALFALARQREGIVVNAVNPGMAWTPATEALTPEVIPAWRWIWPIVRWMQRRAAPASAASHVLRLATSAESGRYFDERKHVPLRPPISDVALQERALSVADELAGGVS